MKPNIPVHKLRIRRSLSKHCQLKNSHNLKVEILLDGNVKASETRRQHLSSHEKTTQGGRRASQAIPKFATKGTGSLNIKIRYQGIQLSMYGKCKPLGSLNSFRSCAAGLSGAKSCFLVPFASCIPPATQQSPWQVAASAGLQFWEPSFTSGGRKLLIAVTFLVY